MKPKRTFLNNSSDRFTIQGNTSHHNTYCGIHLNGDADMGGDGTLSHGLVTANVIYENGVGGGAAINMDGVSHTIVSNNLMYDNHASGIAVFQINGAVCSQYNHILHNTVLMPDDGRWALLISAADCVGNTVLNNIFYSYHSYRGSLNVPAGLGDLTSDYNVVVDRFTTDDGDSILTLAEWRALGYDGHSFVATPEALFVDPAVYDYRLHDDSPAANVGSDLAGVTLDIVGTIRPTGEGYDIGAYELSEGTTFTPTVFMHFPLIIQSAF